jgi:hypothetical protein
LSLFDHNFQGKAGERGSVLFFGGKGLSYRIRGCHFLGRFPQPNQDFGSLGIHIPHHANLMASLIIIFLINANSVNPQHPVRIFFAKISKRKFTVFGHPDSSTVTSDLARSLAVAIFRGPSI